MKIRPGEVGPENGGMTPAKGSSKDRHTVLLMAGILIAFFVAKRWRIRLFTNQEAVLWV